MVECKETRTTLYTVSDMTAEQMRLIYEALKLFNVCQESSMDTDLIRKLMVIFK